MLRHLPLLLSLMIELSACRQDAARQPHSGVGPATRPAAPASGRRVVEELFALAGKGAPPAQLEARLRDARARAAPRERALVDRLGRLLLARGRADGDRRAQTREYVAVLESWAQLHGGDLEVQLRVGQTLTILAVALQQRAPQLHLDRHVRAHYARLQQRFPRNTRVLHRLGHAAWMLGKRGSSATSSSGTSAPASAPTSSRAWLREGLRAVARCRQLAPQEQGCRKLYQKLAESHGQPLPPGLPPP